MSKREEFDRDNILDFDPNEILDDESGSVDVEFDFLEALDLNQEHSADSDLDDILSSDFLSMLGMDVEEENEPAAEIPVEEPAREIPEEISEEIPEEITEDPECADAEEAALYEDNDMKEYNAPSPAFDVEPELDEEFIKSVEEIFPAEEKAEDTQAAVPAVDMTEKPEAPVRRRKKMSRERIIKEVYLPPVILGLTLILLLTFIGSALGRTIKANKEQKESLEASKQEASSALAQEAEDLVARANALAAGYDYDAALKLLDTFPEEEKIKYQVLMDAYNTINHAKGNVKPIDSAKTIPNLSFHCLIADPARAFIDKDFGKSYNTNYVTIDEFSKILDQLYANGYVLVDFDSFIVETVAENGTVTFTTQPIFLPEDKKPIMITETLVNYETFSIDSDGDGEADKGGDGFASKLVVRDGKIVNEYVDADGNTLYGAYDLVPILEEFIEAHPDFCYRGARATLAVSGEDGIFGYRIMHSVKESKGEDYYNQQVEGAKAIAQALRDRGYTIACYTYANVGYGAISATNIQVDLDNWKKEVKPVLGDVPVLVYAKASDISADGNYEGGNKYNVLKDAGFRYFISSANVPYAEITVNYVRQSRIMVTGNAMITYPQTFDKYFNVKDVLNDKRGN